MTEASTTVTAPSLPASGSPAQASNQAASQATPSDPVDAAIAALASGGQPGTESPVAGNVAAEPGKPEAKPETPAERQARTYAKAADAKRRAAQAEKQARLEHAQAKAEREAVAKQKAELDTLFTGAKGDKAALEELLKRSGHNLDSFARLYLGLDAPEAKPVTAQQALEEAQAVRKQIEADKAAASAAAQAHQSQLALEHYIKLIEGELRADTTDKYESVKETGAFRDVLGRCLKFLETHAITEALTPAEEKQLIAHCAYELEAELVAADEAAYQKALKNPKVRSKMGITTNPGNGPTTQVGGTRSNNDIALMDPESRKLIESLESETTATPVSRGTAKSNRFITNDTTVSSRPNTVANTYGHEDEIDRLVKELYGGK